MQQSISCSISFMAHKKPRALSSPTNGFILLIVEFMSSNKTFVKVMKDNKIDKLANGEQVLNF